MRRSCLLKIQQQVTDSKSSKFYRSRNRAAEGRGMEAEDAHLLSAAHNELRKKEEHVSLGKAIARTLSKTGMREIKNIIITFIIINNNKRERRRRRKKKWNVLSSNNRQHIYIPEGRNSDSMYVCVYVSYTHKGNLCMIYIYVCISGM